MEQAEVKSAALKNKSSEENVRHTNSDTEEKIAIRTKNGLVNGVTEEKCKSNKKNAKSNSNANVTKESKKKKGHSSGVHNSDVDVSNTHVKKNKSGQKSSKIEASNHKNCVTEVDIKEESKTESLSASNNCSHKADLNTETSQLNTSQSEIKSIESNSKGESKRKKNKSKINKTEQNAPTEQSTLRKFDITSIINSTVNNENLVSKMPDSAVTSELTASNPHLLDYQDNSSEFEKDLIESIKNLKIQQDTMPTEPQDISRKELEEQCKNDTAEQEENLFDVEYVQYESELQMPMIMKIIQKDLSEPYSIYTYRYFIHNWPKLCFLAMCEQKCVGAIVCKLDFHRKSTKRGYIAMLAVDKDYRKRRIGSTLVRRAIKQMIAGGADEVVLETEVTNKPALRLYEQLGFVRDKRLFRYYLNGVDALRLKLWLR